MGKAGHLRRAYVRSVKAVWTIADLDASIKILPVHISEALQYRAQLYTVQYAY